MHQGTPPLPPIFPFPFDTVGGGKGFSATNASSQILITPDSQAHSTNRGMAGTRSRETGDYRRANEPLGCGRREAGGAVGSVSSGFIGFFSRLSSRSETMWQDSLVGCTWRLVIERPTPVKRHGFLASPSFGGMRLCHSLSVGTVRLLGRPFSRNT